MSNSTLPVTAVKGVGKARASCLSALGIESVGDLVTFYPRAYEYRGNVKTLDAATDGEKQSVVLTVATEPKVTLIRRGMSLLKFRAYDESGSAEIIYFNQDYMKDRFALGETYRFFGKVEKKGNVREKEKISMPSPAAEKVETTADALPPLTPVYRLTAGLTQNALNGYVKTALALCENDRTDEILPAETVLDENLCTHAYAIRNIHAPESGEALAAAKKRLIFEEFFLFALGSRLSLYAARESGAPVCVSGDLSELTSLLPYSLTRSQEKVIREIKDDMAKSVPMHRLVCGDVGSGKTICAFAALFAAARSGKQAALMVPTEILATQHYTELEVLFAKLGIRVSFLSGSLTAAKKRHIKELLASHETDIVVGTHALITENVEFADLGLVVTDEQHRFGAAQRDSLAKKGNHAHTLVMSATPIPRSLAMTIYGDLDLSVIDEMPKGRQKVDTFAVDESYRERLNAFISKLVNQGGQVYVVCPAVEDASGDADGDESSEIDMRLIGEGVFRFDSEGECAPPPLKSAVEYSKKLAASLPDCRVALVHGKMKSREKDDVMNRFAKGDIDVLVSTTVIEVGVNVPNACLMIVENAERFGLSQLHQLRGRVGRGARKSYCVLVSDSVSKAARERIDIIKSTSDGFEIANKDLAMRGPGDFIGSADGIRQSGALRFRLADMCSDAELLTRSFNAAKALLTADPNLEKHSSLREAAEKFVGSAKVC